jgi:hypothetical protein
MIMELISVGFLLSDMAYHRWHPSTTPAPIKPQEVSIPRCDAGTPVPLIYGRCRVRKPILAWTGTPVRVTGNVTNGWPSGVTFYQMDMFFVIGIVMADGVATSKVHGMWAGDRKFDPGFGFSAKETPIVAEIDASTGGITEEGPVGTQVMFFDGNAAQDVSASIAGTRMFASGWALTEIPSFIGYLSIILYDTLSPWTIGSSPNVAAYSFEASSYKDSGGYPAVGVYAQIGQDSNPVNVLYDLLVAKFGKLGIDSSYIDITSFQHAAAVCFSETHGYSRCIEDAQACDEHIQEILRQIDAAIDEDTSTGKVVITMVRPDFDPNTIPHITRDNCDSLTNFVASGWTGLPSTLRLKWTNRALDYTDATVTAHNQGNAINQLQEEAIDLAMPGVCEEALAKNLAGRELAARSRPIIKCRAIVGRDFLRVVRGQAVKVTWSNPDIADLIFRVANVERGTLEDGKIALDLVSDYFYTFRNLPPVNPHFGTGDFGKKIV